MGIVAHPEEDVYRRLPSASLLLMAEFGQWLSRTAVLLKGSLGKAIGYCQRQWPKLMCYLEDGRLSINNNRAERAIKAVRDRAQELVIR